MRIECIVRCATSSGDRSWTLALCPKGKATSRHLHSRVPSPSLHHAIPTAADLLQLVRYRPEKPAPTSSCRFVGKHWNAKVVRTCLAGQPAIRSSCRVDRSVPRSALLLMRVCLLQPGSSWIPGICRRPFKIRLTPHEKKETSREETVKLEFRNFTDRSLLIYHRSF